MIKLLILSVFSVFLFSYETIELAGKFEPSGLGLKGSSIYVISDNGRIAIIENDKVVYKQKLLKKADYEGITFSDDGLLFVVEEGKDNIVSLNDDFVIVAKYNIPRTFNGEKILNKKGDGLESLVFHKQLGNKLYFYTANQSDEFSGDDKSAILYIEIDLYKKDAKIIKYSPSMINDISGLFIKDDNLYLISDTNNRIYLFDLELNLIKSTHLAGRSQEGIVIFKDKLYIAQDKGDIIVIDFNSLQWELK